MKLLKSNNKAAMQFITDMQIDKTFDSISIGIYDPKLKDKDHYFISTNISKN